MKLTLTLTLTLITSLALNAQAQASTATTTAIIAANSNNGKDSAALYSMEILDDLPESHDLCRTFASVAGKADEYRIPDRTPAFNGRDTVTVALDLAIALRNSKHKAQADQSKRIVRAATLIGLMIAPEVHSVASARTTAIYVDKTQLLCTIQPGTARAVIRSGLDTLNALNAFKLRRR